MHRTFLLLAAAVALLASTEKSCAEPWDSPNDPITFAQTPSFSYTLASLPLQVDLKEQPWSDTYWPSTESGIAHRWQLEQPNDWEYSLYSREELQKLDAETLLTLSPAEKFDIFAARYNYPTVHSEWQRTSPNDATWEGICHGWAPAAGQYAQPAPITVSNPDGINITFGVSDIKALLSYYMAEYDGQAASTFTGERCNIDIEQTPAAANTSECRDINAGTWHVIVSNTLGAQTPFVFDEDRSLQVWNQPAAGFTTVLGSSRPPSAGSAHGTVKEVRVSQEMRFVKETGPDFYAHPAFIETVHYDYWLEVDEGDRVVGGSWLSWMRPDFVWTMIPDPFFGYWTPLSHLINASNAPVNAISLSSMERSAVGVKLLDLAAAAPELNQTVGVLGE